MSDGAHPDFSRSTCPTPLVGRERVTLAHGGGGELSRELVDRVFLPAFDDPLLGGLRDSTVVAALAELAAAGGSLAVSTDSYVVRPLFFPGGSIGDLAVNGTVNDLAMSGARPLFLTAGFIVEEGFPVVDLSRIATAMGDAARAAGVRIVAGDTKVVERGHGDGVYINTAGVGIVPAGIVLGPCGVRPGDVVISSGTLGDHGMAIMSEREGLAFESRIESDTAPLHGLVAEMLRACPNIRLLRDPTRGGAAAVLNEIARATGQGIEIDESAVPLHPHVTAACEILGLDPLLVASEGRLLAIVPADAVGCILRAMRSHEHGRGAVALGRIVADHPGKVAMKTLIGGSRVIPMPLGEQLPRIC